MGNKHRGQVTFTCDGVPYVLRLKVDSLCKLEAISENQPATEYISDFVEGMKAGKVNYSKLRTILWAGMLDAKPDYTLLQAAFLIDELDVKEALKIVMELIGVTWGVKVDEPSPT